VCGWSQKRESISAGRRAAGWGYELIKYDFATFEFEDGRPTHLFLAAGNGDAPYQFTHTWNMVIPIKND
jgi:hypothetical protein